MCYISVLSLHACEPNTLVEQKCICTKSEVFVLKKLFGATDRLVLMILGERENSDVLVLKNLHYLHYVIYEYSGTMIMRKKIIEKEHKFCK